MRRLIFVLPLLVAAACGSGNKGSSSGGGDGGVGGVGDAPPEPQPGCNPIIGDDCLTPFPSSFYQTTDSTTATGVRVSIPATALPTTAGQQQIAPDRLNQKDGFSPSTPFLLFFANGVDATMLPTNDTLDQSVLPTSTVQVINYDDGTRVPVMAELDANAATQPAYQALIVRPMTRLKPASHYIIALYGLNDSTGNPLAPAPFKALRDKTKLSQALTAMQAHYEDLFGKLTAAGLDRGKLSLAFDVNTASDATATGHLTSMVQNALALADGGTLKYTLAPTSFTDANLKVQLAGTFDVPQYLADASGSSFLNFDSNHMPAQNGMTTANIVVNVPKCADTATAPVKTVVFGHGLFGDAQSTLQDSTLTAMANNENNNANNNANCAIWIGTDWLGLASGDIGTIETVVSSDLNKVWVVTDRLQQAHVNINTMTRLWAKQMVNDPQLQKTGGGAMTDGKEIYYLGISNGGIQGATFMGVNPDIVRGVLNVPGCDWSLLMFRSADFNSLKLLLNATLHHPIDQQVYVAQMQSEWDYTDPATFAPHIINDPLPGVPQKHVLLQMSIGDGEVTNLSTEMLARTMGVSGFDLEFPVYGVPMAAAPLDSAYTQWDSKSMPLPPATDTALSKDNGAHTAVYPSPLAESQMFDFMTPTGQAMSVCTGGVCDISMGQ